MDAICDQVYTGELKTLNALVESLELSYTGGVILVDSNTLEHCLPVLDRAQIELFEDFEVIEVEPGEATKSPEIAAGIWQSLLDLKLDRNAVLVGLGGGVVGDLTGFIAATYLRGIDCIQVPTSLLAMIDASTGGKTGINLGGVKNQVGTFTQPRIVFVDPTFLHTLPDEHRLSGYAEMIKHGLVLNANHLQAIQAHGLDVPPSKQLIKDSIRLKADVVRRDFKERNDRKLLNFGHTVGHAYEAYLAQHQTPHAHGLCIAAGMWVELELGLETGLSAEVAAEMQAWLTDSFSKLPEAPIEVLIELMSSDKKRSDEKLNFTLIEALGKGVIDQNPTADSIYTALNKYMATNG